MMIRSLWRGLGRKTPAPNRSMSNREAPVAIISIAQQARPNVIGQMADLRAQLTPNCTGLESIIGAAILCRTKFVIESTVVRTNPSSCSATIFEGTKTKEQSPTFAFQNDFGLWTGNFGLRYAHSSAPFRHA